MNFDPEPIQFLSAALAWLFVVGLALDIALGVAVLISLILHGLSGPVKIVQYLTASTAQKVAAALGLIGGAAVGGWAGWALGEGQGGETLYAVMGAVLGALQGALTGFALLPMLVDALTLSPRRVGAISMLTVREGVRRKALMVFIVFAILFMFAGWFLTDSNARSELQIKVYISFVLTSIAWLILPVMLLLACWGLPEDIRLRSLHTVVTKPTRRNEVVLGRMLGFTLIGTLLLAIMGTVGYFWIVRQVPDDVQQELVSRVPIYGELTFKDRNGNYTTAGVNTGDTWKFRSYIEGATDARAIWTFEDLDPAELGEVISLESSFESFRTHKGKMGELLSIQYQFVDDTRERFALPFVAVQELAEVGELIDEGNWYRAASRLKTLADGLEKEVIAPSRTEFRDMADALKDYPEVLAYSQQKNPQARWPAEVLLASEKTRSAAASQDSQRLGSALKELSELIRTNNDALRENIKNFALQTPPLYTPEYHRNRIDILHDSDQLQVPGKPDTRGQYDIYDDVMRNGRLRVEVAGLDHMQYIGMARPDLFIRTPDRPFLSGYGKSMISIWLLMTLVVVLGVCASTFVKGPVATFLTFALLILGSGFHDFIERYSSGEMKGYGSAESAYRLIYHLNPNTELETQSVATDIMLGFDKLVRGGVRLVAHIIPDIGSYSTVGYVSNGFDVPVDPAVLGSLFTTLGFFIPCLILGYYSLKLRELEAK